jgi:UDP-N-acetylmuramate dehydrogenase
LILGGGSNILFSKNFRGLIIKISIPGIKILEENNSSVLIESGAGVIWNDLIQFCIKKNLGGIENLSLIPGTVGAAPMQNIGAYGTEIRETFHSLSGVYIDDGSSESFNNSECDFGYRNSIFKNKLKNKFIITYVRLKVNKHPVLNLSYGSVKSELEKLSLEEYSIKDVSKIISKIRLSKLPDPAKIGNAGSFFKNPEIPSKQFELLKISFPDIVGYRLNDEKIKVAAGWLIEKCGWKGKRRGNTGVHEKQALVIVNYGNATGKEIVELANDIKDSVKDKFGIELEEEVNIV